MPRKSRVVVQLAPSSVKKTKLKNKNKKTASMSTVGQLLRLAGSGGGGALGAYFGNPGMGSAAGGHIGAALSKWLGYGDYTVKQNSIVTQASKDVPMMHNTSQSVIVRHREYIGVVKSSTEFKVQYQLPINPGMLVTFPWLADVAHRFQEYVLLGAVFHYIPSSGNAISGTSPSLGNVMMQTSYRASDTPPMNKLEMLNEYCASESVPSEQFVHPIECDPKENPFMVHYIRNTVPPVGEPLMSYDLGKTFIATQGQLADDNVLGDLWITYEVELKKPLLTSAVVYSDIQTDNYSVDSSKMFLARTSHAGPDYFTAKSNVLTFLARTGSVYAITVDFWNSNFSSFDLVSPVIVTNCTASGDFSKVTSGSARAIMIYTVTITDNLFDATVNFDTFTRTGTATLCTVTATRVR